MPDLDLDRTIYSSAAPLPPEGSLFETFADKVLRRVDEVIEGRNCAWPTKEPQRRLLALLRGHQGKQRAVPLGLIGERMKLSPRAVKELVQDLRMSFGVQIGASRDADGGGYYLVATETESDESTAQLWSQAIAMLRVVAQMRRGRQQLAQMLSQIELELKEVAR
jgi:biotin operon repressor